MSASRVDDGRSTVRTVPFTLFGILFQLGIAFASGILVARVISPAAYGVFSLARTWCETTNLFTKAGFDIGVVRYLGAHAERDDKRAQQLLLRRMLWVVFVLGSLPVVALLIGGASWLESSVYSYAGFAVVLTVLALSLPFMAVLQVLGGMFRGYLHIGPRIACELILQPAARLLIIIVLFVLGFELGAVVAGTVLSFILAAAVLFVIARNSFLKTTPGVSDAPGQTSWSELFAISKYSLIISLTGVVAGLLNRADLIFLGYFVSAADVGRYAVVQTIVVLIALFSGALNQTIAPLIARSYAAGDMAAMRVLIQRHSRWVALSTFPVFVVIAAFGDRLMVVFGKDFTVHWSVVALLALVQFLAALLSSAGFLLSMTGRHKAELYIMLIGLVFNVALSLLFIPRWGLTGAAAATCCAVVGANVLRAVQVYVVFRIASIGRDALRPLLIGGALAALMLVVMPSHTGSNSLLDAALYSGIFSAAYTAMVLRFGLVDEDRVLLTAVLKCVPFWGRRRCGSL